MAAAFCENDHDLPKLMNVLSVDKIHPTKLELDDNVLMKLNQIINNYESIFSWDVKRLTGINQNLMSEIIDKVQDKLDTKVILDNTFNINRFYLQLIISYEMYIKGNYEESLLEFESIVKSMETYKFDDSDEQYSDAYYHVALATNAYIALTLNLDCDKMMKDIKPVKNFNRAEKSAICAIKARVFMEYPPKGNEIALKFADHACNLQSTESEWIVIWLKAKGRVRRFYAQFKMPDEYEIDAAEMICTTKTKSRFLIQASKLYMEIAFINKINHDFVKSDKFYKLSSDLTYKAIGLAKDDISELYSCLLTCIDFPKEFHSKTEIDKIIQKLSSINNSRIHQVLGKYYLKHEKDYEKAKMYLSCAMASGHFNSSLQLIKLECILHSVEKYPLVNTLNLIYDIFSAPKRRLIILSQILMYYCYYEDNPKELMHYLKLYMDQDIDYKFKKSHLIFAFPLFKVNGFKAKQFYYILSTKIKNIKNCHNWSTEEICIIDDTLNCFNDMKMTHNKLYGNQVRTNNKTSMQKQYHGHNSKNKYSSKKPLVNESDSQKRQVNCPDIDASKKGCQIRKLVSEEITSEKHAASNIVPVHQTKNVYDFKKPFKTRLNKDESNLYDSKDNLNKSKSNFYETKFKKFETQYSSLSNLHQQKKGHESNRQNQTNKVQHQEDLSSLNIHKHWKNSQHSRGGNQNNFQKRQNRCTKHEKNDDKHDLF